MISEWVGCDNKFAKSVVVVLPGTFGVGRAAVELFAAHGASVVFGGRDETAGRQIEAEIASAGGSASFKRCDLLQETDVQALLTSASERHGSIDAVFGCPDLFLAGAVAEQTIADFDLVLNYNCRSLFFAARAAIPLMVRAGGGSVVFMSSVYGLASGTPACAYEVASTVVGQMTRALAARYGARGVRVNCLAAGLVYTEAGDFAREVPTSANRPASELEQTMRNCPTGRLCRPDEVARAAVFLAGDDARYINGTVLPVDGGLLSRR